LFSITLLTRVNNTISASRSLAVSTASIRDIGIGGTIITLFVGFNNTVTTVIDCTWINWYISVGSGWEQSNIATIPALSRSGVSVEGRIKCGVLIKRECLDVGRNKPLDILSTWRMSLRTLVVISSVQVASENGVEVDNLARSNLTTSVESTDW
jgi:hypothetical protein